MPFTPPIGSPPESILGYGEAKVGKSSAHLSIAEMYLRTNTPGTFYIIDTDNAMDRMLFSKGLKKEQGGNVEVLKAIGWEQYREASDKAVALAEPGDWIVVDFVDRAWTAVRNWYFDEFLEEAPEQYFIRKKKELVGAGKGGRRNRMALYEDIDWDVVNPEYNAFIQPLIGIHPKVNNKGHLFMVCEEKDVWKDGKPSGDTKPGGQGGLPYQVHSVIRFDKLARGRIMNNTTYGDRERPELKNEVYESFALSYLGKAAGWSITS